MQGLRNIPVSARMLAALLALTFSIAAPSSAQEKSASTSGDSQVAKAVGTIKRVQPDSIILAAETGGDMTATLTSSTKILRVPPGEKDLKNATALQSQDLQPGDRILVRGHASKDPHTIAALSIIVMKQSDLSAKQQRERDDWQKRGVGGLVTKVDPAGGAITISSGGLGANRNVVINVTKDTILRRYSPGSVRFDDAQPAPLAQIKSGDQVRARGTRSGDGATLTAEEVVSGSFRNIAGTITAIDTASKSITVQDLIAKAPVVIKVAPDSQMKTLPPEMVQRFAARLKGGSGEDAEKSADGRNTSAQSSGPPADGTRSGNNGQAANRPNSAAGAANGSPDLQRLLSRLPNSTLADLQKGEAVMLVATQGDRDVTAITLLGGVDSLLSAAQSRSTYSLLSPWSLNTSGGEGEGTSP